VDSPATFMHPIMQSVPRHLRTHHVESHATFANTSCNLERDIHAPYHAVSHTTIHAISHATIHAISHATFANTSCSKSRDNGKQIMHHIMQSVTRQSMQSVTRHSQTHHAIWNTTFMHVGLIPCNHSFIFSHSYNISFERNSNK